MNQTQKDKLLHHLGLARELGFEFMPGVEEAGAAELVRSLTGGAPPKARPAQRVSASGPSAESDLSRAEKQRLLDEFAASIANCQKCRLCEGRTQVVFGAGSPDADLMFIGEAPGFHEDKQGIPFVGKAGQLLTKIIEAMQFSREDVYIANVIKCRPPDNRDPNLDEVEQCEPHLLRQIEIIKPKVIVTLGVHAAKTLLRNVSGISAARGRWAEFRGIPLMPTYHPAYLLRTPSAKGKVWSDMKKVMERFGKDPAETMRRKESR